VTATAEQTQVAYKVVKPDGTTQFGHGRLRPPEDGGEGEWLEDPRCGVMSGGFLPELCRRGYHGWLALDRAVAEAYPGTGFEVWEVELDGDLRRDGEKACGRRMRFVRKVRNADGSEALALAELVWQ
jgi:hypothetical protein